MTFHLAGINNQNFVMQDEETRSWWQQVSGEAILGPLKGRRLKPIFHDELTFAIWRRERPGGRVLLPDPNAAGEYAGARWEEDVRKLPLVTPDVPGDPLPPRELIIGIDLGGEARAYRFTDLLVQSPVLDRLGGREILIVVGEDGKSVRAFDRTLDGRVLEFFARPGSPPLRLIDSQTGSEWDFTGGAVAGPFEGRRLDRVAVLPEFWFDWRTYHPATDVHAAGLKRK